jgi:hypothetical protein
MLTINEVNGLIGLMIKRLPRLLCIDGGKNFYNSLVVE